MDYKKMSDKELIERATNKSFEFSICKGEVTLAKDVFTELLDERTALSDRLEAKDGGWVSGYLGRQIAWSRRTFGEAKRTEGICRHIEKELGEIREDPSDLSEWVDVVILAMDGYWRHGGTHGSLAQDLETKQAINFRRTYPFPTSENEPSEHDRSIPAPPKEEDV